MNYWAGPQAIVVGGSIAGLIAARVLSDFFEQVLVIERDEIADRPVISRFRRAITSMRCCMATHFAPSIPFTRRTFYRNTPSNPDRSTDRVRVLSQSGGVQ
jgi:flavin-dependent dehydrogenase